MTSPNNTDRTEANEQAKLSLKQALSAGYTLQLDWLCVEVHPAKKLVKLFPNPAHDTHLKQALLEAVGEDEIDGKSLTLVKGPGTGCWACYEDDYCPHEIRDQLRAQLRQAINKIFGEEG